jgi:hypothetical protein
MGGKRGWALKSSVTAEAGHVSSGEKTIHKLQPAGHRSRRTCFFLTLRNLEHVAVQHRL